MNIEISQSTIEAAFSITVIQNLSVQLDSEFHLREEDFQVAGMAMAPFLDAIKERFAVLKKKLDDALVYIRIHGRDIIDRIIIDITDTFHTFCEELGENAKFLVDRLESLLQRWRDCLYERALTSVPIDITTDFATYSLSTVQFERTLKLEAGVKPSLTSLLEFVASGTMSMSTTYQCRRKGNESICS